MFYPSQAGLRWAVLVDRRGVLTDEVCPEWVLGAYRDGFYGDAWSGAVVVGIDQQEAASLAGFVIRPWPRYRAGRFRVADFVRESESA